MSAKAYHSSSSPWTGLHWQEYRRTSCLATRSLIGVMRLSHLLSKLLNEDEAANEDVGICNVLLELLIVLAIPQLLQKVADNLKAHLQQTILQLSRYTFTLGRADALRMHIACSCT